MVQFSELQPQDYLVITLILRRRNALNELVESKRFSGGRVRSISAMFFLRIVHFIHFQETKCLNFSVKSQNFGEVLLMFEFLQFKVVNFNPLN